MVFLSNLLNYFCSKLTSITLFFYFSRFLIRLALPIFLKRLLVINFDKFPAKVPVLLASNHSDSFFDALIIGAVLKRRIYTLARGDAFKKKAVAFWLRQINLIPVFRGSEGRQYVKNLDVTTQESHDAMKNGDVVIVFSEGVCVNEWKLRPLGKGTARMAYQVWYGEGALKDMEVVPTGLTYEHFRGPGKRVALHFGNGIKSQDIKTSPDEYEKWLREFNEILDKGMNEQILTLPEGITKAEKEQRLDAFYGPNSIPPKGNILFRGIGWFGRTIHKPVYSFFVKKAAKLTVRSVFYDSVLFGLLLYLYPLIVTILSVLLGVFAGWEAGLALFITLPVLAWFGGRYR